MNICQLIPRDPDQAGPGSAVRFLDRGHRDLLLTHQGCFSDTQWASAIWNLIMDIMAKLDQNITPCWIGRRWCAMLCHAWTCAGWLTVLLQTNHGVLCHLCVSEKRSYQRADLFLDVRVDSEKREILQTSVFKSYRNGAHPRCEEWSKESDCRCHRCQQPFALKSKVVVEDLRESVG